MQIHKLMYSLTIAELIKYVDLLSFEKYDILRLLKRLLILRPQYESISINSLSASTCLTAETH